MASDKSCRNDNNRVAIICRTTRGLILFNKHKHLSKVCFLNKMTPIDTSAISPIVPANTFATFINTFQQHPKVAIFVCWICQISPLSSEIPNSSLRLSSLVSHCSWVISSTYDSVPKHRMYIDTERFWVFTYSFASPYKFRQGIRGAVLLAILFFLDVELYRKERPPVKHNQAKSSSAGANNEFCTPFLGFWCTVR